MSTTTTAPPSLPVSSSATDSKLCSTPAPTTPPLIFESLHELFQLTTQLRRKIDDQQAEIDALVERTTNLEEKNACLSTLRPTHNPNPNQLPKPQPAKWKQVTQARQIVVANNGTSAKSKQTGNSTRTK